MNNLKSGECGVGLYCRHFRNIFNGLRKWTMFTVVNCLAMLTVKQNILALDWEELLIKWKKKSKKMDNFKSGERGVEFVL